MSCLTIEVQTVTREGARDAHGAVAVTAEPRRVRCAAEVQPITQDDTNGAPNYMLGATWDVYVLGRCPFEVTGLDQVWLPGDDEPWQVLGDPEVWSRRAGCTDHVRFRIGRRQPRTF